MLRARMWTAWSLPSIFMMQERVDSYFRIEPALEEVERSLGQIEEELEHVSDVSWRCPLGVQVGICRRPLG